MILFSFFKRFHIMLSFPSRILFFYLILSFSCVVPLLHNRSYQFPFPVCQVTTGEQVGEDIVSEE